jgi:dienelactone hydrolase
MTYMGEEHISKKRVVYRVPGMESVDVRRDVGPLGMDTYYPESRGKAALPAVIFVSGYSDPGFQAMIGCRLKEMGSYISWGELTAASGIIAITYSPTEPAADTLALILDVRSRAESLGIDKTRIGIWACSGNVPNALWVAMNEGEQLRCAVLCYGLMLDLEGGTTVAEATKAFGMANPVAGKSVSDMPKGLPLLIVRAGQDQPGLNETIDRFVSGALAANLPVTAVNLPGAPHAFDIMDDSEVSREAIRQILSFMRFHLL